MFEILIRGFKTKAQAEAFYSWYEGQGEQDACIWFECRKEEGDIDVDSMLTDVNVGNKWVGDCLTFEVTPN